MQFLNMITLNIIKRTNPALLINMENHYSKPKGFVGRNICYEVKYNNIVYGHIVAGSATLHLQNRHEFLGTTKEQLNNIVNNIFYHVEKIEDKYPTRNFTSKVLKLFRLTVMQDWFTKYNNNVLGFETLIELPRTGDLYLKDGWQVVGQTIGYTCKRGPGKGTDSWSGKRIWDTKNLRPKLILCRKL